MKWGDILREKLRVKMLLFFAKRDMDADTDMNTDMDKDKDKDMRMDLNIDIINYAEMPYLSI